MQNIDLGQNLYDMNKQLSAQQPLMPKKDIEAKRKELEHWFNWQIDTYAMLLCHEQRDYTVFHLYEKQNPNPPELAAKELIALLEERGRIVSIDHPENDTKAWEIWVRINCEDYCYFLFCYDKAVIEV